jgi:hypothetical protein
MENSFESLSSWLGQMNNNSIRTWRQAICNRKIRLRFKKKELRGLNGICQNSGTIWNLRIIGIKEGAEVEDRDIEHIFNKVVAENFPNLEKEMPIQIQEAFKTPNRTSIESSHVILKLKH